MQPRPTKTINQCLSIVLCSAIFVPLAALAQTDSQQKVDQNPSSKMASIIKQLDGKTDLPAKAKMVQNPTLTKTLDAKKISDQQIQIQSVGGGSTGGGQDTVSAFNTNVLTIVGWLDSDRNKLQPRVTGRQFYLAADPKDIVAVNDLADPERARSSYWAVTKQCDGKWTGNSDDLRTACYSESTHKIYLSINNYSTYPSPAVIAVTAHEVFRKMGIETDAYELSRQMDIAVVEPKTKITEFRDLLVSNDTDKCQFFVDSEGYRPTGHGDSGQSVLMTLTVDRKVVFSERRNNACGEMEKESVWAGQYRDSWWAFLISGKPRWSGCMAYLGEGYNEKPDFGLRDTVLQMAEKNNCFKKKTTPEKPQPHRNEDRNVLFCQISSATPGTPWSWDNGFDLSNEFNDESDHLVKLPSAGYSGHNGSRYYEASFTGPSGYYLKEGDRAVYTVNFDGRTEKYLLAASGGKVTATTTWIDEASPKHESYTATYSCQQ